MKISDYTLPLNEANGETIGDEKWQRMFNKVGMMGSHLFSGEQCDLGK